MTRYLLDTGAISDLINRRKGVDERARAARVDGARLGTCIPVLGELCFGIEFSRTRDENLARLRRALAGLSMWPYTREAARNYGRLAAQLKRQDYHSSTDPYVVVGGSLAMALVICLVTGVLGRLGFLVRL